MSTKNVTLIPALDIATAWAQTPNDSLAHHFKIDEGVDTPDDEMTRIYTATNAVIDRFRLTALPADLKQSLTATSRCRSWSDGVLNTLSLTFYVNGHGITSVGITFDQNVAQYYVSEVVISPDLALVRGDVVEVECQSNILSGGSTISITALELALTYTTIPPDPNTPKEPVFTTSGAFR